MSMNYEEMLAAAEDKQSYHLLDELPNEYNGKDTLATGRIKDNYIYVLVHDGQLNSLNNGEPISAEYFFDQATYDQYVDPKTGNFDSKKLSEALQVKPYQSYDMMNGDGHAEYRNSIACFKVNGTANVLMGYCEANTQFGGGGAHEAFIPDKESIQYQESGILVYNRDKSLIHTGINNKVDSDAYAEIDVTSTIRVNNCKKNNAKHPNLDQCKDDDDYHPFESNEHIAGSMFGNAQVINEGPWKNTQRNMTGHDAASDQYRRGPPDNVHSKNSTASETHDSNTHSSDDIAKGNHHADADATEAKRDSVSESKETSKDIASKPEGAGAKEQKADSQPDQGNNERASSEINANATDDSLSKTKTADASEKATESGSDSLEHETDKAQPASEITADTPEASGQTSTMQPDNNLAQDANNESPHGQSESNAQNTEPSHASSDQAKQSDESHTSDAGRKQAPEGGMSHDTVGRDANDSHEAAQAANTEGTSKNMGRNESAQSDSEAGNAGKEHTAHEEPSRASGETGQTSNVHPEQSENADHQTPHGQTGSTVQHDHPAADTAHENNGAENHKTDSAAEQTENNSADAHVEKTGTSQDSALANEPTNKQLSSASSDDTGKSNEAQDTVQSGGRTAGSNVTHDASHENANNLDENAAAAQSEAAHGRENAPATSVNTSNAEAAKPDAETNHPEREQSSEKASVNAPQEENNPAAAQHDSGENGRNSTPEHQAAQEQSPGISNDKAVDTAVASTKDRSADQASATESPKHGSSENAHSVQSTAGDSYNREQSSSSNTPQRDSTALAGADSHNGYDRPEQSNTTGPNVNDHSTDKAYENGNTQKEASASRSAYDGNKNGESSGVPDSYKHSDTRTGESNDSAGMQNHGDTQSQRSYSADAGNSSDGMPSKGHDTHLNNDAAVPPNAYQHNSNHNETAEGMSSSENVAATSDKSESKASSQDNEVSGNLASRNGDSAQIPNSAGGKDTNSGAEKASGNNLNNSGSTNESKNNGLQQ